jgi:hypothetical protein
MIAARRVVRAGGQVIGASDAEGMLRKGSSGGSTRHGGNFPQVGCEYEREYLSNIGRPLKIAEGKPVGFLAL